MLKFLFLSSIFVVTLLKLTVAGIVESTTDCNAIGQLDAIDVQNCESLPCVFVKGQRYTIKAQFTPKGNVKNLTLTLTARVLIGVDVPFLSGNVCEYLTDGKSCPLDDGVQRDFKVDFKMSPLIPTLSTKVTALVKDENGQIQACAKIPVKIVNRL